MSRTLTLIRSLGPVDLKSVARDSLLLLVSFGALIVAVVFRFLVPFMADWLLTTYAIDLTPYFPLVTSMVVLLVPSLVGVVVGLLLLDERDEHMLTALLVTPTPLSSYLMYRLGLPVALSFVLTPVMVYVAGFASLPLGELLLLSAPAALSGATTALLLAAFAENKVTGLAVLKGIQGVQMIPMLAFFVAPPLQWIAGIMPSYWPLVVYWRMDAGQSYLGYWLVGMVFNLGLVYVLARRYEQKLRS
ncbi:MAG: hypothetical protein R2873_19160 [Caldilineaceae bacterium]